MNQSVYFIRLNPFLRILFPFLLGIILSEFIQSSQSSLFAIIGSVVAFTGILYLLCIRNSNKLHRIAFGVSISVLFLLLGYANSQKEKANTLDKILLVENANKTSNKILLIKSKPTKKNKTYKAEVEWFVESKKSMLGGVVYFKDSLQLPKQGTLILVNNQLMPFKPPTNPGQFNQRKYAHGNDWYFSGFIDTWDYVDVNPPFSITQYFMGVREHLLGILALYLSGEEYAISAALVFGDKSSLSSQLREAYSGAGAMHVLAVSGLHVGLVYLFLNYILGFLGTSRVTKITKTVLIIALIFLYAGLTGFSPSVTRASVMFALIAIGGILNRKPSIYNIIFVSAFGILLYDPRLLFSVSFQLSYIAVIGIIYLYPKLILLWEPKHWITFKIWSLICLSLAAQISTFPLALYYFKLFPTWFLLTNLVVVPSAIVELGGGFLLIFAHYMQVGEWVSVVYEGFVWLVNQIVLFIDLIPPGPMNLGVSGFQLCLIYSLIIALFLLLEYPRRRLLYFSSFLFLLVLISKAMDKKNVQQQKGLIVYDSKSLMVEIYSGQKSIVYVDSTHARIKQDIDFVLSPSLQSRNIEEIEYRAMDMKTLQYLNFNLDSQEIIIPIKHKNLSESLIEKAIVTLVIPPQFNTQRNDSLEQLNSWNVKKQGSYDLRILSN